MDDITCEEVVEMVTDYLEDALDSDVRHRFESHLPHCLGCRAYLDQMRRTVGDLARLPESAGLPATVRDTLLEALRTRSGQPHG